MARIQVLPLTTERAGELSSTPFVIVIDGTEMDVDHLGNPLWADSFLDAIKTETGARSVLIVAGDLDVANVDKELHKAAQVAVTRALMPERTASASEPTRYRIDGDTATRVA